MKVLAIIPARGGSKGVIRKNIRLVQGKPLIAYAIECAFESKKITDVIVNTDDNEIAHVAKEYNVPILMRAAELATDKAPILPTIKHTIDYFETNKKKSFDIIVLLQTTSPIRTGQDIDAVISMFEDDPALDGVISVVPMQDMHPARMYDIEEGGFMKPLIAASETANRQDIAPVYYRNGCIYAVRTAALLKENTLMVKNKKAYVMPVEWLANIDDERDLVITEVLMKLWKEKNENTDC